MVKIYMEELIVDICLYNGKLINAFDVTNINDVLNYETYIKWKEAGNKGLLICPECKNKVILRVKDPRKRVPHFSHKNKCGCSFGEINGKESEEHKKGKLKLYHYFKEKYPDAYIDIAKSFSNKRRTDLYIEFKSGEKLAVEFQRTNLDRSEWKIRHDFYKNNGINDLWILNGKEEDILLNTKQLKLSYIEQIMLNEYRKMAIYLDISNLKICLSKNIRYIDKHIEDNDSERLFIKSYDLECMTINPDGSIESNFYADYKKAAEVFLFQKEQESLEMLERINRLNKVYECDKQLENLKEESYNSTHNITIGTKIHHRTFGNAEIIGINGNIVRIKYGTNKEHNISLTNCLKGIVVKIIDE